MHGQYSASLSSSCNICIGRPSAVCASAMGYHLLAVFSGTTARPPAGLESPLAAASHKGKTFFDVDHEELERKVSETLDVCSPAKLHHAKLTCAA